MGGVRTYLKMNMENEPKKNPAAVALGRLGGSKNTPAQNAARKRNAILGGARGGRPKKICPETSENK